MKIILSIALIMIFAGVISSVMHFIGYNLSILFWMNELPQDEQWMIRGGLVAAGVLLLIIFRKKMKKV